VTGASGIGLATLAADGSVLDTWFPAPELSEPGESGTVRLSVAEIPDELAALAGRDEDRDTETVVVRTEIASLDDKAADAYDAYLRLHLLSHRLVAPHGLNADGFFGVLTNVVWTNHGPCAVDGFELVRARLRRRGPVTVYGVDKFPRMVDYVVPTGVRVADADRVRRFSEDHYALAFARIECHYFVNRGFFSADDQLIADAHRLSAIPGVIVHGRYDVVTPVKIAYDLSRAWPGARLRVVPDAGHAMTEPGIVHELVAAANEFARS